MTFIFSLIVSGAIFTVVVFISIQLISNEKFEKIPYVQSRTFWKKYDYVWYGSGLLGLVLVWMSLSEYELRNEAISLRGEMTRDAALIHSVVHGISAYCSATGLPAPPADPESAKAALFSSCLWNSGLRSTLSAQITNPNFPASPITQYAIQVELPDDGPNSEINAIPRGPLVETTLSWTSVTLNLRGILRELGPVTDMTDAVSILPLPESVPDGSVMDQKLFRIEQIEGYILPKYSPVSLQGVWWLYVFASLIGLKVAKTYAELRLP